MAGTILSARDTAEQRTVNQLPCVYGTYILETKVESDYKNKVKKKETLDNNTCIDKNKIEWHARDHLGPP